MTRTLQSFLAVLSTSIRIAGGGLLILLTIANLALASHTAETAAPTALTLSVSSATVCAGTSTTIAAAGCPTGNALRWSSAQTGTPILVAPTVTTVYTASCDMTTTTVVTTTAVSTTGTSTSVTTTTALVTTTTSMTASATVQVNPALVITPTLAPASCAGGSDGAILLNVTGGTGDKQYQLNGQPYQAANLFSGLKPGIYPVVVRDARGCTAQTSVEIKQPVALVISVTAVAAKCASGTDGGLIAVASGGAGDYRYYLNNGAPQQTGLFLDLKANTSYMLAVTDKAGCLTSQPVLIGAPTAFDVKLTITPTRCASSVDGSIGVVTAGGTGGYQYQIGTGPFQTGTLFTGLPAGSYDITVQDANGCQSRKTGVVTQPTPLQVTAASRPVNCFGPNSGTITVGFTGGTGAVSYQLTTTKTPQVSPVFTGVAVGDYTVVGTDANGCTAIASVTVVKADPVKVQATPVPATCCVCPTGLVNLVSTGGSGSVRQYQVVGQPYQASAQITGLRPNSYRFRVIDEVGCIDSVAAVVTNGSAITLTPGLVKDIPCAGSKNGEATVQVVKGAAPYTFYWQTEQKDTLRSRAIMQTGLAEGTYTVSVLDSNRCTAPTVTVTIRTLAPVPPKPVVTQSGGTLTVNETTGVQWYIRSGTDPDKPVNNATTSTLVPFASGQYYVLVTQNGCTSPASDALNFILTALAEPVAGMTVRVLPNPVVDRLRVEVEQVERLSVQLVLMDASGRAIRQYQIPAFLGKKQAEWPLAGLSTGSYLLKAEAGSKQSVIRVLVQ